MLRSRLCGLTPRPTEQAPCGSKSTRSTLRPYSARAAPRLIVVVVLPTPPFWLARAMIRAGPCRSVGIGSGVGRGTRYPLGGGGARTAHRVPRGVGRTEVGAEVERALLFAKRRGPGLRPIAVARHASPPPDSQPDPGWCFSPSGGVF